MPMAHASAMIAGDRLGGGVAGDRDHVEAHASTPRHRLELLDAERAVSAARDHPGVLAHGDEGARQAAGGRCPHGAALLDGVVEQRERGGRARPAAPARRPSPRGSRRRSRPPPAWARARGR